MGFKVRGVCMDFFNLMKIIFDHLLIIFTYRIRLGYFDFTIGSVIVGLFIISCSVALLQYLFGD